MNIFKVRISCLVIVFVILLSCLAGCGATQNTDIAESEEAEEVEETPREFDYTAVEMESVDSTCFSEVGYDAEFEVLLVRFLDSGSLYSYSGFPEDEYDSFISSSSLGKYYNSYIKGSYDCERLE